MRIALVAVVVVWSSLAYAQPIEEPLLSPPGLTPLTQPAQQRVPFLKRPGAYHDRMLAIDGMAFGILLSAIAVREESYLNFAIPATLLTYGLGGPIAHIGQGHGTRALASLAMRVSLPAIGFWLGDHSNDGGTEVLGVVLGLMTAMAIDDFYLGRGERPTTEPARGTDAGTTWYGYQTLGTDGLALLLLGAGVAADGDNGEMLAKFSIGTYLLGAPLVHVAHDRSTRALGSLALRAGLPLVGYMIGSALEHDEPVCEGDIHDCYYDDSIGESVLGVMAGVAIASIVDAAMLADSAPPKAKPQAAWTPSARAMHGGFALGLAGNF